MKYNYLTGSDVDFANMDDNCLLLWIPYVSPLLQVFYKDKDGKFKCKDAHGGQVIKATFDCIEDARNFATFNGVIKSYRKPIIEYGEDDAPKGQLNPSKNITKIKLDVKKPVFYKETDEEVRFIHSNNLYHLFEKEDCTILNVTTDNLDNCFYNKPETKTTVEVLDSAWKRACNAGSLWASPTQLFYMAIEQLVKDGVVDMNKVYEVKQ